MSSTSNEVNDGEEVLNARQSIQADFVRFLAGIQIDNLPSWGTIADIAERHAHDLQQKEQEYSDLLERFSAMDCDYLVFSMRHAYTGQDLSQKSITRDHLDKVKFLNAMHHSSKASETMQGFIPFLGPVHPRTYTVYDFATREHCESAQLVGLRDINGFIFDVDLDNLTTIAKDCVTYANIWEDSASITWDELLEDTASDKTFCKDGNRDCHNAVIILVKMNRLLPLMFGRELMTREWAVSTSRYIQSVIEKWSDPLKDEITRRFVRGLLLQLSKISMQNTFEHLQVAIVCAAMLGDKEKFGWVVDRLERRLPHGTCRILGKFIDVDNPVVDLDDLHDCFTISTTWSGVWRSSQAFMMASQSARYTIHMHSFIRSIWHSFLKVSSTIESRDAEALSSLVTELEGERLFWKSIMLEAVRTFVNRNKHNKTFINPFVFYFQDQDTPIASSLYSMALPCVMTAFDLQFWLPHYPDLWPPEDEIKEKHDVATLLPILANRFTLVLPEFWRSLLLQVKDVDRWSFFNVLAACMNCEASPPVLCQVLTKLYLEEKIGEEPKHPSRRTGLIKGQHDQPQHINDSRSENHQSLPEIWSEAKVKWMLNKKWEEDHDSWLEQRARFKWQMLSLDHTVLWKKLGAMLDVIEPLGLESHHEHQRGGFRGGFRGGRRLGDS